MTLTRAQREALKRVWDRMLQARLPSDSGPVPLTYLQFRRGVQPYIGGDCVLVKFCGMWLGIEKDGYTHS